MSSAGTPPAYTPPELEIIERLENIEHKQTDVKLTAAVPSGIPVDDKKLDDISDEEQQQREQREQQMLKTDAICNPRN